MVNITLNLKEQDNELDFGSRLQDIFLYELATKENLLNMLNYIKQEYYRETNIEQNFSLSFYSQSGKLDISENFQDVITVDSEIIFSLV